MEKGNITKISHGAYSETAKADHVAYAKNINTNAGKKINESGGQGIKYDKTQPRQGTKDEMIDVVIGLLFDGTCNNKTNNLARAKNNKNPDKNWDHNGDDSYENDPSNVQNFETIYPTKPLYFPVYIEGVGTMNNEGDYTFGYGLGTGDSGILEKVKRGCSLMADKLSKAVSAQGKKVNTITIDVYGFSRGSTCARRFVHEFYLKPKKTNLYPTSDPKKNYYIGNDGSTKVIPAQAYIHAPNTPITIDLPEHGILGQYLQDKNITYKTISMRFAGLFDSVSAYGVMHKNDISELDLNGPMMRVPHVVHLTAADEHRDNFELTAIPQGITKSLPGVHSDVGGGYRDQITDKYLLEGEKQEVVTLDWNQDLEKRRSMLIHQGWYKSNQIQISRVGRSVKLVGTRVLRNKYSLVPLHLMAEFSKKNGSVTIDMDDVNLKYSLKINDPALDLEAVHKRLQDYAFNNAPAMNYFTNEQLNSFKEQVLSNQMPRARYTTMADDHNMLMELRNRYLHYSSNYGKFGMSPTSDWQRKVY